MQYTDVDPQEGLKYARQAKNLALRRGVDLDIALANNAVGIKLAHAHGGRFRDPVF